MRGSVTSLTILGAALRQPREIRPRHRAADIGVRPVESGEDRRRVVGDFHRVPAKRARLARRLPPHRRSPDSRCSGSSCRRDARGSARGSARRRRASSSCAVSSMPGVQIAALQRVAGNRTPPAGRRSRPCRTTPSMVSTRAPSHCTASIRQPRTIAPSTRTRAGAAHAVLAADMAAGQRQRPRAGSRPASCAHRRSRAVSSPFTVSVMSWTRAFMTAPPIELAGDAPEQHAGEMRFHRARCLHVVGRVRDPARAHAPRASMSRSVSACSA